MFRLWLNTSKKILSGIDQIHSLEAHLALLFPVDALSNYVVVQDALCYSRWVTNDKTVASGEIGSTLLMVGVQTIKYTEHSF